MAEMWTCKKCGAEYGDPLYTGAAGHWPLNICKECALAAWHLIAIPSHLSHKWKLELEALILHSENWTDEQIADKQGCHHTTANRRRRRAAKKISENEPQSEIIIRKMPVSSNKSYFNSPLIVGCDFISFVYNGEILTLGADNAELFSKSIEHAE